jgi:hypothetical protein
MLSFRTICHIALMTVSTRIGSAIALVAVLAAVFIVRSRGAEGIVIIGPGTDYGAETSIVPESGAPPEPDLRIGISLDMPVGAIVAWMKNQSNTPDLPQQWVQCNGQKLDLPSSPYDGATIPNLNGAGDAPQRFLRGALQSGDSGGAENHQHGRMLIDRSGKRTVNVSARANASNLPPYYDIVWIMKVASAH